MIGGTFEYLMSSLPYLTFQSTEEEKHRVVGLLQKYAGDEESELRAVEILDKEAKKFLSASTFVVFKKLDLKYIHKEEFQNNKIKVLSVFSQFTFRLRNEIKVWRTSDNVNEKKAAKYSIEQIIGEGSPLEKEIRLLKYQWDKIEELSFGYYTDLNAVFSYKIKLLILLRWWSFNQEKGYKKFTQMTTNN